MAKFGFDVAEVDVTAQQGGGNYDPVPEDDYTLLALEAEEKETSTGGTMIKVKYEITKGEFKGRWVWQNFNIVNKSDVAQRIGRQQLVSWATACGKPDCDDTDKLIGKSFMATVAVEPARGSYAASNKIKAFLFSDAAPAVAAKPAAKPAVKSAAPSAGKTANPWD